jgi:hypothetical protein
LVTADGDPVPEADWPDVRGAAVVVRAEWAYPADDDAWMSLTEACLPSFEEFTGAAYEDASLELFPITPTRESWALGDRTVSCLVGDPLLEPVTGSLAGKG